MSDHEWTVIEARMMSWATDQKWLQCRACGAARRVQLTTGDPEMVMDEWRLGRKTGGLKVCPVDPSGSVAK